MKHEITSLGWSLSHRFYWLQKQNVPLMIKWMHQHCLSTLWQISSSIKAINCSNASNGRHIFYDVRKHTMFGHFYLWFPSALPLRMSIFGVDTWKISPFSTVYPSLLPNFSLSLSISLSVYLSHSLVFLALSLSQSPVSTFSCLLFHSYFAFNPVHFASLQHHLLYLSRTDAVSLVFSLWTFSHRVRYNKTH